MLDDVEIAVPGDRARAEQLLARSREAVPAAVNARVGRAKQTIDPRIAKTAADMISAVRSSGRAAGDLRRRVRARAARRAPCGATSPTATCTRTSSRARSPTSNPGKAAILAFGRSSDSARRVAARRARRRPQSGQAAAAGRALRRPGHKGRCARSNEPWTRTSSSRPWWYSSERDEAPAAVDPRAGHRRRAAVAEVCRPRLRAAGSAGVSAASAGAASLARTITPIAAADLTRVGADLSRPLASRDPRDVPPRCARASHRILTAASVSTRLPPTATHSYILRI